MSRRMNKAQAEREFREFHLPGIREREGDTGIDEPMRAEAWNNFTDMLCKAGRITSHQYRSWTHPRWLYSRRA